MFRISDEKLLSFYDLLYINPLIGLFYNKYIFTDGGGNILLEAKTKSNSLLLIKSALLFLFTFVVWVIMNLQILTSGETTNTSVIIASISVFIAFIMALLTTYYINTIKIFKIYIKNTEGFEEWKMHYKLYQIPWINILKNSYKLENEYWDVICRYTKQNFFIKKLWEIRYEDQVIDINQEITYKEIIKVPFSIFYQLILPWINIDSNNIILSEKITNQALWIFTTNNTLDLSENINNKLPVLYAIWMTLIFKNGD